MERVISVDMKQLELTHIFIIFVYNLFHLFIFVVEHISLVWSSIYLLVNTS